MSEEETEEVTEEPKKKRGRPPKAKSYTNETTHNIFTSKGKVSPGGTVEGISADEAKECGLA